MKNLKPLFILSFVILLFIGCDSDDFCEINSPTPNLVLRFYNKDAKKDVKIVQRFSIIAQNKIDSLYTNISVDSIAIPLNSKTTETIYTFKKNEIDGNNLNNEIATLSITYTPQEEFISRSCGFRFIFNDLTFEKSGWIDSISTKTIKNINSQANAHLDIFH